MTPIPSNPESVGLQPQPSYYAVIPATVRYCKSLPPAAKLLFGEITALCSVEGFCWASNAYFMALYGVDRSTLQRWVSALAREGFIRVDLVSGTGERRIYDLTIQPTTPPQKCGGGAAKTPPPRRKNAAQSITEINTKSITSDARGLPFVGPGPVPARDLARVQQEEKGSAPPPTLKASVRKIERAVAACRDHSYRGRIGQLWEVVERSECPEVWQGGLDALKAAGTGSTGLVGGSGAYFCAVVVSALNARGVTVE